MATRFTVARAIFPGDENHRPRFMKNQKIPLRPNVNQLAKSAVCTLLDFLVLRWDWNMTYNQAQQVGKHGNGFGDDPGEHP